MKNAFGGLINRLNIAKERINKLKEMSVEPSNTEMQREKRMKKKEQNIQEHGTIINGITYT